MLQLKKWSDWIKHKEYSVHSHEAGACVHVITDNSICLSGGYHVQVEPPSPPIVAPTGPMNTIAHATEQF